MGASFTGVVDFGAFPGASDASVTITGLTGIGTSSIVAAWINCKDSPDHSADEHMVESIKAEADASTIVAGTSVVVRAFNTSQINEPMFGPRRVFHGTSATTAQNLIQTPGGSPPSVGGLGTRLWGQWNVAGVWQ